MPQEPKNMPEDAAPAMSRIRVLLAEDDAACVEQLRRMLAQAKTASFEVSQAAGPDEAIQHLSVNATDLVLLDLALGGGGTLSLVNARRIQAAAPEVPIIVLSSVDDETFAIEAVHEGAQDYLVRGEVTTQLLVRSIRYAIERKRAEVAIMRAEENYHGIFNHIVEGIFRTTPEGRYLDANPALARIYGYDSPEEMVRTIQDISRSVYVDPGRREDFLHSMEKNDVTTGFESQVYRKDGSVIWISENVRAIRDLRDRVVCFEGTVEDITQRKLAEESVRNSEALYHSLVETLPQNIFRKDLAERFTFANRRFCQTLNRPLEEIVGKTDFDFFPPELAEKYQQDDRRIIETGEAFETVEEHRPPGGGVIYVQVVKTPLYDAKGQIIGLQGIFWDITEKKLADERVQRANAELARSREELRQKNDQMEEDIRMAREIQQAILPQQYPTFPRQARPDQSALRFCHRYFPSGEVGGDFFHIIPLSDTEAGVFICDVMGHGVRSALVTAIIRALVEELTPKASDPGVLLTELNRTLRVILRQSGTPMFTTAFYLVADLERGKLRFANAGHPRQILVRRSTAEVMLLANADGMQRPPLGLFEETSYLSSEANLRPGDLVLLHTDGLFEVEGMEQRLYSQALLREAIVRRVQLPTPQLFDALLAEILGFSYSQRFSDDVCMVGMDVIGGPISGTSH